MRQITVKYDGNCAMCGEAISAGQVAEYERFLGIFHAPCLIGVDIRQLRDESRRKKADKLEARATRLEQQAEAKQADFNRNRQDIAWLTQPGHIPGRERVYKSYDKGIELQNEASRLKDRAESLRSPARIAGDAEAKREAIREEMRPLLRVGMKIKTVMYGEGEIVKINRKNVKVKSDYYSPVNVDISWITL